AGIVDDILSLGIFRRKGFAYLPGSTRMTKVGANDEGLDRSSGADLVGERLQAIRAASDQRQFVTVTRKDARQRNANACRGARDDGDRSQTAHSCLPPACVAATRSRSAMRSL